MVEVSKNFGFKYNLIDPENIDSIGLNPFVYDDPTKIAITISSVIKGMYATHIVKLKKHTEKMLLCKQLKIWQLY